MAAEVTPRPLIKVVYLDETLAVVCKPAGMPSQSDKTGDTDLLAALAQDIACQPDHLFPVHRLDRPVSGLVVVARSAHAQTQLTQQLNDKRFTKRYLAVVNGRPEPAEGELTDYLVKNEKLNLSRVTSETQRGSKAARLVYRVLANSCDSEGKPISLVEIQLETGRHHQIRVQLAHAGWPLWGDTKYNPGFRHAGGWHQIALMAAFLSFTHPISGLWLRFKLDLPDTQPFNLFAAMILEDMLE